jgi:hypothetical protein
MSNYKPSGTQNGRIINGGYVLGASGNPSAADSNMLGQQQTYAAKVQTYIGNAGPFFRGSRDVTGEIQNYLIALSQSVLLTPAQANTYFSGTTDAFWGGDVVDWLAGYNLVVAYHFQG